ncbi:MAG: PfkB family carbohydrate kinase [Candidatus Paceibacterota bacterium]|jgi:sugar/nucleoside kinase (ribokinase family)
MKKKGTYYDAVVGVSVNPEMELTVENTAGPKKTLRCMTCCLSGSSGNTATAIKCLGGCPHLVGLVGTEFQSSKKVEDILLRNVIEKGGVPFTPLEVLSETNHAVIPVISESNGEVWGKKGNLVHSVVSETLQDLAGPEVGIGPNTFVVITGLRAVEMPFAEALLFQAQPGYRLLNAKDTLCASKEFKKILPLVDILVLNKREFDETGMDLRKIHSYGPRIIVVTAADKGGLFSLSPILWSHYWEEWKAVSYPGGIYETGAGDWFLGALVSELIRLKESASIVINSQKFSEIISFAAKVAGKKVTIPGGGNGPSRHQLR